MKKSLLMPVLLMLASLLAAWDFDYDGELRTRAAVYNNSMEKSSGHIDNRLDLGMSAQLHPSLKMRTQLRFGDVVWGGSSSGGGIPAQIPVHAYELWMDYRIRALNSNIRLGQIYWRDYMGLLLDDSYSGALYTMDNLAGFQAEIGWVKALEVDDMDDDNNYLFSNLKHPYPMPWGMYAAWGHYGADNDGIDDSFTIMPYAWLDMDPVQLDVTGFVGMHFNSPGDDNMGFGTAVKATADLGAFNVSGDMLFATENGVRTLSPHYQNGLYIYGNGQHHDGLNLYWNAPYDGNNDTFLSLVGSVHAPLNNRISAFANAGIVLDHGFEVNGSMELQLIPDLLHLAGYAAAGFGEQSGPKNYAIGTTIKIPLNSR